MNQNPAITDDPLPEAELVTKVQADAHSNDAHAPKAHTHTDPHSLAAVAETELHDPDLHRAQQTALATPELHEEAQPTLPAPSLTVVEVPEQALQTVEIEPSKTQALNAHMAQVGLTSSDQWEEHFQPRIQKLTEDIALVHVELDKLERKKSTK
jgi:hypothetical protein